MEKATAFVLSVSLTGALLFTGGDACAGVSSMSAVDACKPGNVGAALSKTCAATLGTSTAAHEVTAYVTAALDAAWRSYNATTKAANADMEDPSSPRGLREVIGVCLYHYDDVVLYAAGVLEYLRTCTSLREVSFDCATSAGIVDRCAGLVQTVAPNSTLHAMIVGDRDRTELAVRLALLM
ncbi:hypothetical protein GUJ93_ZPchr0010g7442 [Zizania palustris]|uniref:Pectinesterase inhibitor domain-containing protein n=1 Tax=Zizania palustris TaxID=103762 RepID=A0A8J5WBH7_ZIZPA|nr:hypothetical protein GUJ93_ZPchr0010g7442 [Zizania palustris]